MTGEPSSCPRSPSSVALIPGDPMPSASHEELPSEPKSEDEVDEVLRLQREGGVKFMDYLLAKALPPDDSKSPDTARVHEWTFRDIIKMPSESQKEWKQACRKELESLRR